MKKSLIFILIISFLIKCNSPSKGFKEEIIGEWVGDSTKNVYKGQIVNTLPNLVIILFEEDSVSWGTKGQGYSKFAYSTTGSYLNINGEEIKILELNKERLVIERVVKKNLSDVSSYNKAK